MATNYINFMLFEDIDPEQVHTYTVIPIRSLNYRLIIVFVYTPLKDKLWMEEWTQEVLS